MGTIVEKFNYTKTHIDRLKDLTQETVLEKAVDKVEENYGEGDNWKPEPDWWDIDKILEEDTEDYPAKMIVLLTDGIDEMSFNMNVTNKIAKIKTSDGAEYTESATHIWNKIKDKECSIGYKTRYYIIYFSDTSSISYFTELPCASNNSYKFSNLYIVVKNLDLTIQTGSGTSWFNKNYLFEYMKCINSTVTSNDYFANNNYNLKKIDSITLTNGNRAFMGCGSLIEVGEITLSTTVTSLEYMFSRCLFDKENPWYGYL